MITGWPVGRVRLLIEVVVLGAGWALGGTVGVGTLMFALLIGPSVALGLALAGRMGRPPGAGRPITEGVIDEDYPELDA